MVRFISETPRIPKSWYYLSEHMNKHRALVYAHHLNCDDALVHTAAPPYGHNAWSSEKIDRPAMERMVNYQPLPTDDDKMNQGNGNFFGMADIWKREPI